MKITALALTAFGLALGASQPSLALPSLSRISDVPGLSSVFIYEDHENVDQTPGFIKLYYNPNRSVLMKSAAGQPEFDFAWINPDASRPQSQVVLTMQLAAPTAIEERFELLRSTYAERYHVTKDKVLILPLPIINSKVKSFALESYIIEQELPEEQTPFDGQLPFHYHFTYEGTNWFRKQVVERRWRFAQYEAKVQFYNEIEEKVEQRHLSIPLFVDVPVCAVAFDTCETW